LYEKRQVSLAGAVLLVVSQLRVFGAIHLAHAAFTNLVDDAVMQKHAFWFDRTHLALRG